MSEMKNGRHEVRGIIFWYLNDLFHREDGPAVELPDGTKEWWINGKRHREDQPAIEWSDGTKAWFLNDKHFTEEQFNHELAKKALNEKLHATLPPKPKEKKNKI